MKRLTALFLCGCLVLSLGASALADVGATSYRQDEKLTSQLKTSGFEGTLSFSASGDAPGYISSALWQALKSSYLARFPEAEAMTMLGDFRFICITPSSGRHVAGFGAAREVSDQDLIAAFNPASA